MVNYLLRPWKKKAETHLPAQQPLYMGLAENTKEQGENMNENNPNQVSMKAVDEKKAAAMMSWSVKTLQARRYRGEPPRYYKVGRSVRYLVSDLQAYLESCLVEPVR